MQKINRDDHDNYKELKDKIYDVNQIRWLLNLDQIKEFDYELVDSQIRVNINPLNTFKNIDNKEFGSGITPRNPFPLFGFPYGEIRFHHLDFSV